MFTRRRALTTVAAATAAALLPTGLAAHAAAPSHEVRNAAYTAEIAWSNHGVPHITATDMGSLGFGNGYAAARDNVCIIADLILTVDARRTQTLGATQDNVISDTFQGYIRQSGIVEQLLSHGPDDPIPGPSAQAREVMDGFAAGYNQWLGEQGGAAGISDPTCRGRAYVRPITALDLWRRSYDSVLRASSGALSSAIVAAQPPSASAPPTAAATRGEIETQAFTSSASNQSEPPGSNAYGLGAGATVDGHGIVLGNPHFPWNGGDRFWQSHLTIPGELDVQGSALIGTPGVQIGFTAGVAWSHTVSTAQRFALRQLQLGATPTSYVVDGVTKQMTATRVAVPGGPARTVYSTEFGPMVIRPDLGLSWTDTTAYALQDANADNMRSIDTWDAMDRAQSVDELLAAEKKYQGIPWVNTTGADSTGTAVYAQLSTAVGVPDALAQQCIPAGPLRQLWQATGTAVLDGSRSACDPKGDASARVPGILGPDQLPVLTNRTYVTQSNDSHWLSNPDTPLTGYARVIGDEGTQRSLRTRLGILQVQERIAGTDGLPGQKFTVDSLKQVMFGDRQYGGELTRDSLVTLCRAHPTAQTDDNRTVTLASACDALAGWNLREDLDSTGAALFREFARAGGLVFAVPFDIAHPVTTPNTLKTDDPKVLTALATATARLQDAQIALDAPLGTLQTEKRGDVRIPIHGGVGAFGAFNVISASFQGDPAKGVTGYPDVDGNSSSYIQAVELTGQRPQGSTLLTYSQSADPTSPFYADQTLLYSQKQWVPIAWTQAEIDAVTIQRKTVTQTRQPVPAPDYATGTCATGALPASPFSDVSGDGSVAVAVRCLLDRDITQGTSATTYTPFGTVSRAQMVLFLARYVANAGATLPTGGAAFTDSASLSLEVRQAAQGLRAAGIVQGRTDGSLHPAGQVTRGQMAAFLVRLERFVSGDAQALTADSVERGRFTDADGTFSAEIDGLASAGVTQGVTADRYEPGATVSRQQMAVFLARLLEIGVGH